MSTVLQSEVVTQFETHEITVDLVLVKPPDFRVDLVERFNDDSQRTIIGECLGLAYISSSCKAQGVSTEFIDAFLEHLDEEELVKRIVKLEPLVVVFQLRYPFVKLIRKLSKSIKLLLPSVHILVGGQYPSINAALMLDLLPQVDSVCIGDGEYAVADLVLSIKNSRLPSSPRIYRRKTNSKFSREEIVLSDEEQDLNRLPFPDRKYLSISHYYGFETVGISTSRGCPFRCAFCVPQTYSRQVTTKLWRARSAENIIDEMQEHYHLGKRMFTFSDEHFLPHTAAKQRAQLMVELIKAKNMTELFLMFDCRADSVELELFKQLREVGLLRVFIGFESSTQPALQRFTKDLDLVTQIKALTICNSLGIDVIPGMIFFDPLSTLDEVEDNVKFRNQYFNSFDWDDYTTTLTVIPNTPIATKLQGAGLLGDLIEGIYQWQFLDPKVEELAYRFQSVTEEIKSRYFYEKSDLSSISKLKKEMEKKLLGEIDKVRMQIR